MVHPVVLYGCNLCRLWLPIHSFVLSQIVLILVLLQKIFSSQFINSAIAISEYIISKSFASGSVKRPKSSWKVLAIIPHINRKYHFYPMLHPVLSSVCNLCCIWLSMYSFVLSQIVLVLVILQKIFFSKLIISAIVISEYIISNTFASGSVRGLNLPGSRLQSFSRSIGNTISIPCYIVCCQPSVTCAVFGVNA